MLASGDHNVLITFTSTRVPSLLTAMESDRRTRAKIWLSADGVSLSGGVTKDSAFWTAHRHIQNTDKSSS